MEECGATIKSNSDILKKAKHQSSDAAEPESGAESARNAAITRARINSALSHLPRNTLLTWRELGWNRDINVFTNRMNPGLNCCIR